MTGPQKYGEYVDSAWGAPTPLALVRGTMDPEALLGQIDPQTGKIVLSPSRTLPTAIAFVERFYRHLDGCTMRTYAGLPMTWRDNRYTIIEDSHLRQQLQPWLHDAMMPSAQRGQPPLVPFAANPTTVRAALESVKDYTHLSSTTVIPSWLKQTRDRPVPTEILPCRGVNVHVPTGRILAATPSLFVTNALDFDFDPHASPPPAWHEFLGSLWPEDSQAVDLLQEFIGYSLVADTSLQKMLMIVGPKRSGKGTIGRVWQALVGRGNVAAPTVNSLAAHFGLQGLIGKTLAIVSDARFHGDNIPVVVERLLCISGEDTINVPRKYLPDITVRLPTRFVFFTNELPTFRDASTALSGRFMILRLSQSFFGREDVTLTDRLLKELPGILLWAIDGLRRLRARGRFVMPDSSSEAVEELDDLASPIQAFVRDCCIVDPSQRVSVADLFNRWRDWCSRHGRDYVGTTSTLGRDLSAGVPGIRRRRGTKQESFYEGIGLARAGGWSQ